MFWGNFLTPECWEWYRKEIALMASKLFLGDLIVWLAANRRLSTASTQQRKSNTFTCVLLSGTALLLSAVLRNNIKQHDHERAQRMGQENWLLPRSVSVKQTRFLEPASSKADLFCSPRERKRVDVRWNHRIKKTAHADVWLNHTCA